VSARIDFEPAWAIVREAVATWAFPGAVACIVRKGETIGEKAFGRFTYEPGAPAVTAATMYDLASVSKTMVAWGIMSLLEEGRVDLDTAAATYLPQLRTRTDPDRFTIRQLLCHTSGLPSNPELHQMYSTAKDLWTAVFTMPLQYRHQHGLHAPRAGRRDRVGPVARPLLGESPLRAPGDALDLLPTGAEGSPAHRADRVQPATRSGVAG
jgi:CubicO group peptidase (beta-lactamase class C family)